MRNIMLNISVMSAIPQNRGYALAQPQFSLHFSKKEYSGIRADLAAIKVDLLFYQSPFKSIN